MLITVRARLAPVVRKRRAKFRWRIAVLMNRLPGQCWADLVTWAIDTPRTRKILGNPRHPWRPVTSTCRSDAAGNDACYCGKIRNPGGGE